MNIKEWRLGWKKEGVNTVREEKELKKMGVGKEEKRVDGREKTINNGEDRKHVRRKND